ncbi:MAG: DUF3108 domain-containing protein [Pseudomonadota bacterium]|nr:DUF3108 domain-containing protein [Pseudomonadota bacterium]
MKSLLLGACLMLPLFASAQTIETVDQAAAPAPAATPSLQPFVASYEVFRDGKALGEATMQVVGQAGSRWRVDLTIRGTRGLFGLAGINAGQSTVFDKVGESYRPLTQATVNKAFFTQKKSTGTYDWAARSATWRGDVKEKRSGPVALQDGDMSGLLINLAVIRDAAPGRTLSYRFVDNGRAREHRYVVAAERESISIGGIGYMAMRVDRIEEGDEETVIWVVSDVPTPIRMLQREGGVDTYDLRLLEYKGV